MSEAMQSEAVHARPELLAAADQAARDKGIERDEVLEAMEQAIQKAGRSKYGHEHDIRAVIDRTSGAITLARYLEVVEDADAVENEITPGPIRLQLRRERRHGKYRLDALEPRKRTTA